MELRDLLDGIDRLRRRAVALTAARGAGVTLAATLALLALVGALDWAFRLPGVPRGLLLCAALGVAGWLLVTRLVGPVRRPLTVDAVAGRVEQRFPELQDRLRSAVQFATRDASGSTRFRDETVRAALAQSRALDFSQILDYRPAGRAVGAALGAVALTVLLLLLIGTQARGILLARLFNPATETQWPKRVQLDRVAAPDRAPAGERVAFTAALVRGDPAKVRPVLHTQIGDGPVRREFMQLGPDGKTFAATVDAPEGGSAVTWWVVAGDDEIAPRTLAIVPRLALETATLTVAPPAYVRNAAPSTFDLAAKPATVTAGSRATLALKFNKPLRGAVRLVDEKGANVTFADVAAGASAVALDVPTGATVRFKPSATDADEFDLSAAPQFEVAVRPDGAPAVSFEEPRRNEERTAQGVLPIVAALDDDLGVADVTLHAQKVGSAEPAATLLLVRDGAATPPADAAFSYGPGETGDGHRLALDWAPRAFPGGELKPGDVIEFWLTANDFFEQGGQRRDPPVESQRLRLTILSDQQLREQIVDDLRGVGRQVRELRSQQTRTATETDALAQDLAARDATDAADAEATDRLRQQQASVAVATRAAGERLAGVDEKLAQNRVDAPELADMAAVAQQRLDRAAEGAMKDALSKLAPPPAPGSDAKQAKANLDAARADQDRAAADLDDVAKGLADVGTLSAAVEDVQQLLDQQRAATEAFDELSKRNGGKTPEELSPEDRAALDDLADRQRELGEKTDAAVEKMAEQAKALAKSDPAAAQAMDAAAKKAQSGQVSQQQKSAAQQAKQNKRNATAAAQQQAELGLEVVLAELKQADNRKLAELQRKLAELSELVAGLARRQADHNLDALELLGDRAKIADEARAALVERAARPANAERAPAALATMQAGQAQTERNTRDVGRAASDVEDGAEIASRLTRAAGQMERALVLLRDGGDAQLAEAFDPPQTTALALLVEAQQLVDQKKQEADEKALAGQKEAIRARLEKLRDEQKQLADDTVRLGANANDRAAALKLAGLSGEQGKLGERLVEARDDLSKLGSVVYVWTARKIEADMATSKAQLAARELGPPTQRGHGRIVRGLGQLIDSLKVEPKPERFENEQANGGGGEGGSQGGPKLPPEAELRLVKALQEAVNGETKDADAAKGGDDHAAVVTELGDRQGELRALLAELLAKSSNGRANLGPEREDLEPLPEEANADAPDPAAALDDAELGDLLLGGDDEGEAAGEDAQSASRLGDRMTRARLRLARERDAGAVTQLVQQKVVEDLDKLIELAQRQSQSSSSAQAQGQGQGQQRPQPKPGDQQAQQQQQGQPQPAQPDTGVQQSGNTAQGNPNGGGPVDAGQLEETAAEWGKISPRLRGPMIETRNETVVEPYRKLVEEYTKAVSTEATKR